MGSDSITLLFSHKIFLLLAPLTLVLPFLKFSWHAFAPGPLYLLFFLPSMFFSTGRKKKKKKEKLSHLLHICSNLSLMWPILIIGPCPYPGISNSAYHLIFSIISFAVYFSTLDYKIYVGEGFCWFGSLLYPKCLEQYL